MSERPAGRRRDREEAPTRFTLAPLLEAQVFTAGQGRLTCGVGGREYSADLGEGGEIFFEGHTFKSPSAFSVYVKRKVNPSRKADDGWTSVKYNGELLSIYRPKLEELISLGIGGSRTPVGPSLSAPSPRNSPLRSSQPRRKRRRRDEESETSEEWDEDLNDFEASDEEYKSTHRAAVSRDSKGGRRASRRGAEVARTVRDYISNEQHLAELEDGADNKLLDQENAVGHMAGCTRGPLSQCTAQEFEEDLYAFLSSRKENELVKHLRNKRITCNNTPIDIFGLYREVVRHGGFVDNERYDDYNRWIGGINFAGQIFPKMANFTANNRATSIGNQLLSNYRKFLLAYEVAHRAKDLEIPEPSTTQAASGLEFLANIASGEASGDVGEELDTSKVPKGHRSRGPRTKKEEDEEPESALKEKRRKVPEPTPRNMGRRVLAALRKVESLPERAPPGALLLAQDPVDLNRHWPVLVAPCSDLPRHVASGGCSAHLNGDGFPQTLREAVATARPEDAYPVCVFGSQEMGWVEAASCRSYSLSAGESAMAFVRPDGSSKRPIGSLSIQQNQACARALKLAAQYVLSSDPLQMVAKAMVTAAGTKHTAQKLLAAEGKIPSQSVLCSGNFQFWQHWRRNVELAQSPVEVSPLIVALAHQVNPEMLSANSRETLWEDLRYLLDMELPQAGNLGGLQSNGVSVLSVDDAISALDESLDWPRIFRVNNLGGAAASGLRPQQQASGNPALQTFLQGRNGTKPDLAANLKNCASNTDLAQFAAAAAGRGLGPSLLGAPPFRGDEPGTNADDDRVSGLRMPAAGEPLGPIPQEVERIEKDAQVDSTGSAEGQGSMRGQQETAPQADQSARQPSPDNASQPQLPQGFQQYKPPAAFSDQPFPVAGQH